LLMAGTGGDYSTEWCWILSEIEFVARHGAGTTRETATEFLIDEVAAGRIPFRYSNFWIEGPAIMPEHFWLRDPSVRHEVAVDNSVVRHGPGVTLAENAKGEHILVLATAPPARPRDRRAQSAGSSTCAAIADGHHQRGADTSCQVRASTRSRDRASVRGGRTGIGLERR
jgi:hypothetical protein